MADLSPFHALPDDARLWIRATAEPLSDDAREGLLDLLSAFVQDWTSHGHAVDGAAAVLHGRFLVVAAVATGGIEISGCGIDDLAHAIDQAASRVGIEWVPSLHVLYRADDGAVVSASRRAFQTQAEEGVITAETPVFAPSLTTLGALRDGQFEQPARTSWHARLLGPPAETR